MPVPQRLAMAQSGPQSGAMIVARIVRITIPVVSGAPIFRINSFHSDFSTLRRADAGVN
jgi:hypothetical protein